MEPAITTIGYEGASIETFIAALKKAEVQVVVDIREVPLSRKQGFSKNHLAKNLRESGIGYVHLQGLGNPKAGRELGKHGDEEGWHQVYISHLQSKIARVDMKAAVEIATNQRAALLCFERNPLECHRLIAVKDLVLQTGQDIEHLFVDHNPDQYAMFEVEDD